MDGQRPDHERADTPARLVTALRGLLLPAPVVKVGLFFLAGDAAAVVSVLGRLGICHLDPLAGELQEYLAPYFPECYRETFRRLREVYDPLAQRWQLAGETVLTPLPRSVPSATDLDRSTGLLAGFRDRLHDLDQRGREQRQRQADLKQFAYYVRALAALEVNVQALADLRFLHVRAGTVPAENLRRLQESAALEEDLVLSLGAQQELAHVLVVGAGGISAALEGLLAKAHFQPLKTQALLGEGSESIVERVQGEIQTVQTELRQLEDQENQLRHEARPALLEAASLLAHAAVFVQCEEAMQGRQPVAFLSGWVVAERVVELEHTLAHEVVSPVAVVRQPAGGSAAEPPPSPLVLPALLRPGAVLVNLFGTPAHDELNPALVLAATTPLFFGMMFGDLGQGLLLASLTLAARRRLGRWVAPALACSLSSAVFGLLYGSAFGFEVEYGPLPLWLSPLKEPFRLLAISLWVGVGFLLLTFVLKAVNLVLHQRWPEALLGFQGGAGALCYLGAFFWLRGVYQGNPPPVTAILLVLAGLVLIGAHAVGETRKHGRPAVGSLLTEFFHGGLGLLTNTLSFLRLGAFALNHAALSLALFLLVDMIPASALGWVLRVLLLVVGSILIVALDVLVVAVQTIRLEFYEGLTRYYRGDGREFTPLRFPEARSS